MGWGKFRKKLKGFVAPLAKAAVSVAVPGGAALVAMHQARMDGKRAATQQAQADAAFNAQVAAMQVANTVAPPPSDGSGTPTAPVAQAGNSVQPQGAGPTQTRQELADDLSVVAALRDQFPVMAKTVGDYLQTGGHIKIFDDYSVEVT